MVPILDNGHGGVIAGKYQTQGKRSPLWANGVLYEGEFNRWIARRVMEMLGQSKLPYYNLVPEDEDISLKERVDRANRIWVKDQDAYLISIHANAGGGEGLEVFTSVGETTSDLVADVFLASLENHFPGIRLRTDHSDGDADKEADFTVLHDTACPAILVELGFMDHPKDYELLWCPRHRAKLAKALFVAILDLSENPV